MSSDEESSLLSVRTSPELMLECVLLDAVEVPCPEAREELAKHNLTNSQSVTFRLDVALAPYKLAIVHKRDDENARNIAHDLKRMLHASAVNGVLVYAVENDTSALDQRYESLDLVGVPYSLYVPSGVTRDGFCFVRSRETTLTEKTHFSLVVKHFRAILDSLAL